MTIPHWNIYRALGYIALGMCLAHLPLPHFPSDKMGARQIEAWDSREYGAAGIRYDYGCLQEDASTACTEWKDAASAAHFAADEIRYHAAKAEKAAALAHGCKVWLDAEWECLQ